MPRRPLVRVGARFLLLLAATGAFVLCAHRSACADVPAARAEDSSSSEKSWRPRGAGDLPEAGFAYFFGSFGSFLKLDLTRRAVVAQWSLADVASLAGSVPPGSDDADEHRWSASHAVYVAPRNLLLAIVPKPGTELGGEDWSAYRLIALVPPDLSLVGVIDLPHVLPSSIHLVVDPSGGRVWLSYWTAAPAFEEFLRGSAPRPARLEDDAVVETVDLSSWERRELAREPVKDPSTVGTGFVGPRFGADGETMYDASSRISFADGKQMRTPIDPAGGLGEAQLAELQRVGAMAADAAVADASGGRALYATYDAQRAGLVAWVAEPGAKRASPPIPLPLAHLFLTAGGERLVAAELSASRHDAAHRRGLTGDLRVHDPVSGVLLARQQLPQLAGDAATHGILCVSPDGSFLLAYAREAVVVVDLRDGRSAEVASSFRADHATSCAFADR